jgi:hypothetical protein
MIPAPGAFAAGVAIFLIVMWDAFEAIILPRRVTRRFRLTRLFYKTTWTTWRFVWARTVGKGRETLLGFFGPIAADFGWRVGAGLVFGFGLMQYGAGSAVVTTGAQPVLYRPVSQWHNICAGTRRCRPAFAAGACAGGRGVRFRVWFSCAIIGYLPFIYGSFSSAR